MASEWKRYKTSELIREKLLTIGDGYRATNSEMGDEGIPFARAGNINDGFNFGTADLLKPASVVKAGEKVSQSGDVVFTSKGTVGRFAFVDSKTPQFAYSPQLCYWRSRNHEKLDPRFLFYWMQGPAAWSQINWAKGQTDMADYVSLRDQREAFWLDLPSPKEQRYIAHILGALDNKIELNRQLNSTLEQLARTLFQAWFVDFEPVRAKASEEPEESICRRLGLTPEILALFPAALEDSAMGEIPVGWKYDKVGNLLTVVDYVANGSFASLKENVTLLSEPGYALYVRTTDYNSGFSKEMRFVDEAAYRFLSKSSLDGSETIISNVGDVGTVFRAPSWLGYPMTLGSNAVALKAAGASNYVFQHFKGISGQHQLQTIITGSAQLKFNKTSLRNLPLMMPSELVLDVYEKLVEDLNNQQIVLELESRTLAALRDELLPKLLSGEIYTN
jgi:type I restriction enzyme S subunit